jgi:hypothetical protein
MSWRYKTVVKDINGWLGTAFDQEKYNQWLEEADRQGWEFVSSFAMKTGPNTTSGVDTLVLTFRQQGTKE